MSNSQLYILNLNRSNNEGDIAFKGTDRLCKVVKLSMQCCRQIIWNSIKTYTTFPRCIATEFEHKVDIQNHEFGWVRLQNRFFLIIK